MRKSILLAAILSGLLFQFATATAADAVSGASATRSVTVTSMPSDMLEPSEEAATRTDVVAIVLMGIALAGVMFYWARKIGREGYHKTNSSYPGESIRKAGDTRATNITTPIP